MRFYQGKFKPKNPQKYAGNIQEIVYRSSWELHLFRYCDLNEEIVHWGSEEIVIPYVSPIDNRTHRYFPDLILRTKSGKIIMVEIKPFIQTQEPKPTKNKKQYQQSVLTYLVNTAKWAAAKKYCEHLGWEFTILTEQNIFGGKT